MPWKCRNCSRVRSIDVGQCRSCGSTEAENITRAEAAEAAVGVERPQAMSFEGRGRSASSSTGESDSSVWKTPDVNPDGSMAGGGVATPEPVQRSRWDRLSLEKWWIKTTGNVRYLLQIVGVALVLLTGYNLLVYPFVGIEIWFGYRDILVGAIVANGGNEFGLYVISDIVVMVVGMIAAWFV